MPRIVAAAIKFKPKGNEYFQIMCGKRHAHILQMMYQLGIEYEKATAVQGFLTEEDQFLDRYDAYYAAVAADQLLQGSNARKIADKHKLEGDKQVMYSTQLYSEDLW